MPKMGMYKRGSMPVMKRCIQESNEEKLQNGGECAKNENIRKDEVSY